jgi:CelD/BcsL family acetyltransferase involved in cellulose biosynthesis
LECQHDTLAFNSPLNAGFAGYMKTLGSHMNCELRRTRRKLEAIGPVELRVASDPETAAALLRDTIEQKAVWCRATGARDLISKPPYTAFYDAFVRQHVGSIAHSCALMAGDRMIAGNFGLVWRGRFYGLIQSSDFEKYRVYSPGNHLLVEVIRWCCENGISLFDFSIGSETYKGRWADNEEQLNQHWQAVSVTGKLVTAHRQALNEIKSKADPKVIDVLRNIRNKAMELMS